MKLNEYQIASILVAPVASVERNWPLIRQALDEHGKDHHKLDVRVTKLEERQYFYHRMKAAE